MDFVIKGGQRITAGEIEDFRQKLPLLNVKAEMIEAGNFPHLPAQVKFLVRFVEDVLDEEYEPEDVAAVGEAIFALKYLLQDVDIIPDDVPEMGYADDSSVIRSVLIGHEPEMKKFAQKSGLIWEKLTTLP